ncbi:MAG TPA: acetyl-CoA carboxylase biotin carboxyl carrier protein [Bryobacteraceae bacterium]|nr:acetyl-CoA carboxylase biotin carboxyl carrier protein [Bryobacteraceae bacterium]
MTIEEIKEIMQLFTGSGVAEIEVQRGENRVWIKRSIPQDLEIASPQVGAPVTTSHASQPAAPVAVHLPLPEPLKEDVLPVIKAPIVGTFYDAPSPGAPDFVKVGDTIQAGQVLCIIESMKLMNEIEAEAAGVIVNKLVPNGKPVEYGEALFTYRPL